MQSGRVDTLLVSQLASLPPQTRTNILVMPLVARIHIHPKRLGYSLARSGPSPRRGQDNQRDTFLLYATHFLPSVFPSQLTYNTRKRAVYTLDKHTAWFRVELKFLASRPTREIFHFYVQLSSVWFQVQSEVSYTRLRADSCYPWCSGRPHAKFRPQAIQVQNKNELHC